MRAHFSALRKQLSAEEAERNSLLICKEILDLLLKLKEVKVVLMFYPITSEPDVLPLFEKLRSIGIRVAFPISHVEDTRLEFKEVSDISELTEGAYGIKEPPSTADTVTDFSRCVCIVPALAFDRHGMRIGYGKGYYDRFLKSFDGASVGVAFSQFVVDSLPYEDTDFPIDIIITEGETIIP